MLLPLQRDQIRELGLSLGFARVGFASVAGELHHGRFLLDWTAAGLGGTMDYLGRDPAARCRPTTLLSSARTAIVALADYGQGEASQPPAVPAGRVARFARGPDYHGVLARRLTRLAEAAGLTAAPLLVAVDTRPLLERELAAAAGLGFIGKNTMLIAPGLGSYTTIGVILTAHQIAPDAPGRLGCGRCRLCVEACPTGALLEPYLLDARRCLAALTIEQRGPLPEELMTHASPWLFGCDRCQEVCPFNQRRRGGVDPELSQHSLEWLAVSELLELRSAGYRRLVRGRALRRASRVMLARNAALLARGHLEGAGELRRALELAASAADEGLRKAARWALGSE